jgi:hypothetical protein
MNWELVARWVAIGIPLLVLVLQGLMAWFMWSMAQKFVTSQECKKQCQERDERCNKNESRLTDLEQGHSEHQVHFQHQVTTQDLEKIYNRMNTIADQVSDQGGQLASMRRSLDLIHQHLLENSK